MAKLENSIPISQVDPTKHDVYHMAGGRRDPKMGQRLRVLYNDAVGPPRPTF
jgi:hypothetical protein